jgi:phosphatidylserine/phosphatidylglycerophosphate/cardiolipin synthase-like enzyme
VVLSDPTVRRRERVVLNRIIRAIRNTEKGEAIRIAVWNYDDRATTRALLDARRRGVRIQIVVASSVRNANWRRTARALNRNRRDRSFAVRCRGGCRSPLILHSKFVLFSSVHRARHVSMVGSFNLTRPAGNRQWNDLVTTRNKAFYRSLVDTFREYARDRNVRPAFRVTNLGKKKITLWPAPDRNTIRRELRKVRCWIPKSVAGDGPRRTRIRIAIAGWFDAFGYDIAKQVRRLWNRGCDVKIVTTLAGRGVNRKLRSGGGRGPVPIRRVTIDRNEDGIPERYLHMKAVAIRGVFAGDPRARVVITGSPNWSTRARRSDEIIFRFLNVPKMARSYIAHVNRLYGSPWAHRRTVSQPLLGRMAVGRESGSPVPEWFELE